MHPSHIVNTGSVAKIEIEIQVYSSIFKDIQENVQGFSRKNSSIFKDQNIHFPEVLKKQKVILR